MKERKQSADEMLQDIVDYLEAVGWTLDNHTLFYVDPITGNKHLSVLALQIQLDRDLMG